METNRQKILDSLYHHCKTRSYTSKEILGRLVGDIVISYPDQEKEKLLCDIIREYKNTGKNLEGSVNSIYDILYPKVSSESVNTWFNNSMIYSSSVNDLFTPQTSGDDTQGDNI